MTQADDKEINESIEISKEKRDQFEAQRKQNRQSYIYYNLDKLKEERNEKQQKIRHESKYKPTINYVSQIHQERKEIDLDDHPVEEVDNVEIVEIVDTTNTSTNPIIHSIEEMESLKIIDENKEETIDDIDEEERDRLEREKLEQELNDNNVDYAQSESFSGINFMQNDFLEQYQKHIENMSNS